MKKLLFLPIVFVLCLIKLNAQQINFSPKQYYITTGTGINYENGMLGLQLSTIIKEHFMPFLAIGSGSWGYKVTPGIRYFFSKNLLGAGFGLSYSQIPGVNSIKQNMELNNGSKTEVEFVYKAINTINISYLNNWHLGKKSNFFTLEVGYSFSLNSNYKNNYTIKTPNVTLSSTSESVLQLLQPGGLIIGVGFNFGL